jgi:hypothetical protein
MNVYAAGIEDVIGTIAPGPFGELNFSGILSWGVSLFFFGVGMIAFIMLLQGALNWVTSGGDEKKLGDARKRITAAAIGLIMSILIFVIWTFIVGPILGIYKNGLINIPTINSMCKGTGAPATNISECCNRTAPLVGGTACP